VDTFWSYDPRGYVTNIIEQNTGNSGGNDPKVVSRTFDAYGQLSSETVTWNGTSFSSAGQNWDVAGRRTGLGINGASYNFASRADGALIYASDPTGSGSYSFDTAGLLTGRTVGNRSTSITLRDGEGRPLSIATTVNTLSELTESLTWSGDGLLATHTLYRPDFTDSRVYSYAGLSRRLAQEQLNLNGNAAWTNSFSYDSGTASGPGVLTQMGAPSSTSADWNGGVSPFSRVNTETNTCISYPAYGRVNGQSTLTALLDGQPLSVTTNSSGDPSYPFQWRTLMELTPGVHQLQMAALHPSGFFTAWATNSFTNNFAQQTATIGRDPNGNIGQRIWHKPDGTVNHQQQLYWDAKNRLTDVFDGDGGHNGYYWHAEYDGLDRRLFTECYPMIGGEVQIAGVTPTTINQYYDPQVEFLELGVNYGTRTEWKLYGPDVNGRYGGLNGTGGLDGVSPYLNLFNPVISDFRGNILAEVTNGVVLWNAARPTGYGAVPGHRPVALGHDADVAQSSAWRGRWVDITGYHNIGKRLYDPVSGMWLSYDSAWNERDPNYLTFCGGEPIMGFDPDGRLGNQFYQTSVQQANAVAGWADDVVINTIVGTGVLANQALAYASGDPYFSSQAQQWQSYMSPYANQGYYNPNTPETQLATAATMFVDPESAFGSMESTVARDAVESSVITDPARLLPAPQEPLALLPENAESLAAGNGVQLPDTLYHYTSAENVQSILQNGLGGEGQQVFTTPTGNLSPVQAQIDLALSPNRGYPSAVIGIDTPTLQNLGISPIAGPRNVLSTPTAAGGGSEIIFGQPIPPSALRLITSP
jgi:RHS repeat-associated protein